VKIYAESSAVLAWLLGEEVGRPVREVLRRAELVMASDLTLVECERVLIRAVTLGEIDEVLEKSRGPRGGVRATLAVCLAHIQATRGHALESRRNADET
jgi:hypothetical protein